MADTVIKPEESGNAGSLELKDNTVIIVLGASGDLAKKKTFPALFGLYRNQFLPKDVRIIGYARTKMDHEEYIKRVRSYIKTPTKDMEQQLQEFCDICTYISGQYDKPEGFIELRKHCEEFEKGRKEANRIFYMALPPSVFTTVSQQLKANAYPETGVARIIVEKPFGKDLGSSRELQKALEPNWKEDEIFRIDHYLGKEMVKNIFDFEIW
ncbi:similar to glucose-6-phosphate-1-dehydrogenase [Botrytis cinerea T4]|uniref:glucose-6-phosphate dehydrogenase (NADP(+)) n=1 Tax=Botryotinia fuckeliana (strain T4) TaxID=999810 RepID=G2XN87_BOTF4|nr:similar to glucose-6-phosphate-1-dehydrogenase [Botrytis cinerea T4]